ncbi:MAG TPA: hypothetical protein VFY42_10630 [Gemmatimonadales bacterium]|nr:hypothetical protein [Gemmatimonadales bacterium]
MEANASHARWTAQGGTFKKGEYHQKRLDRAQRQLVRAIRALATVRSSNRPRHPERGVLGQQNRRTVRRSG